MTPNREICLVQVSVSLFPAGEIVRYHDINDHIVLPEPDEFLEEVSAEDATEWKRERLYGASEEVGLVRPSRNLIGFWFTPVGTRLNNFSNSRLDDDMSSFGSEEALCLADNLPALLDDVLPLLENDRRIAQLLTIWYHCITDRDGWGDEPYAYAEYVGILDPNKLEYLISKGELNDLPNL